MPPLPQDMCEQVTQLQESSDVSPSAQDDSSWWGETKRLTVLSIPTIIIQSGLFLPQLLTASYVGTTLGVEYLDEFTLGNLTASLMTLSVLQGLFTAKILRPLELGTTEKSVCWLAIRGFVVCMITILPSNAILFFFMDRLLVFCEAKPHYERAGDPLLPSSNAGVAILRLVWDAVEVPGRTRNHETSLDCYHYPLRFDAGALAGLRGQVWLFGSSPVVDHLSGNPSSFVVVVLGGAQASPSRDVARFEDPGGSTVEVCKALPSSSWWRIAGCERVVVLGVVFINGWNVWCGSAQHPHDSHSAHGNDHCDIRGRWFGSVGSHRSDHLAQCPESKTLDAGVLCVCHGARFLHDHLFVGVQETIHLDVFQRSPGCACEWIWCIVRWTPHYIWLC